MFGSDFFANNRNQLRRAVAPSVPIVLTANGQLQRDNDVSYPFHQDGNFWYLTGCDDPDIVLVIDQTEEYFIVPRRSAAREAFDGTINIEELAQISGVKTIYDAEKGWQKLKNRLKKVAEAAILAAPPAYIKDSGLYANPARAQLAGRIKAVNLDIEFTDIQPHLARLRVVKQPAELAALQKAIAITNQTLTEVTRLKTLAKYVHEYEIEADITRGFRKRGASGHAFNPIVAAGQNACTLHHVQNDGPVHAGDFIVLDVGAEWLHYSADITRTVCMGEPSKRQQAVYNGVEAVQKFAMSLIKPGMDFKQYERQVVTFMGEKLRELGLIRSITDDDVRRYFPHATSHFLGLNTHDVGDYSWPLEPGAIITVEPGIYIPEEGIGVRIEDDVLVTPTGIKVLS